MSATPISTVEPTTRVSPVWVLWLSIISIGVWSGFFGPIQVLLAQQAEAISPDHKEAVLSLVTGVGALVSTVLNPLWGAFSDRTTLRVGRRVPWVLGGLAAAVAAMVLLSVANAVWQMVLAWALAQAALNAMLAAITATVPDQVPVVQRGAVGGWLAIAQTFGVVAGSGIAAATGSIAAGYLTIAGVLVLSALPYLLDNRDLSLAVADRPDFAWGPFLRSFWISPREHPDFAWAWLTRFLMNLGNAILLLYLLYYLKDSIGLDDDAAENGVFWLTLLYGVVTIVTAVIGGYWSDRTGRRKPFVIGSGLIAASALALLAFADTWALAIIGATILAIGFGAYTAVDFAMITQVLPSDADRAKDLGVINIANALPQVLAPVVAAAVLGLGLGYASLYLLAAAVSALGSVLVVRIRSLR
ncbi:MFS transporter [Nocardioides alcanivorans]|uniref:MFS transporter n=1 Tax=Nocardioides alcanivorans TaxID=2897352 RepID=UPI001F1B8B59|nr:MFS transporter [Nocardioides alcanivorans]